MTTNALVRLFRSFWIHTGGLAKLNVLSNDGRCSAASITAGRLEREGGRVM